MPTPLACIETALGSCLIWQGFDPATGDMVGDPIPGVSSLTSADLVETFTISAAIVIALSAFAYGVRLVVTLVSDAGEI